jgi:hypothetical protein
MKETENIEKVGATVDAYEVEKSAYRVVVLIKKNHSFGEQAAKKANHTFFASFASFAPLRFSFG